MALNKRLVSAMPTAIETTNIVSMAKSHSGCCSRRTPAAATSRRWTMTR